MPGAEQAKRNLQKSALSPEMLFRSEPVGNLSPSATNSHLTRELLDWAINAMSAVLATSEVQARRGARDGLKHGLLTLDTLYGAVLEREHETRIRAAAEETQRT